MGRKQGETKQAQARCVVLAAEFDFDDEMIVEDATEDYGEERFVGIGFIGNKIHVIVYAMRNGNVRVISLRRATNEEIKTYVSYISIELQGRAALLARAKAAFNSDEEDAAITAAARTDPDAQPNLVRRGRPRLSHAKLAILLRLDPDVVASFKAGGTGWQTRMNDALRKAAGLD